jgi:Domain of unknown function (DUF3883)
MPIKIDAERFEIAHEAFKRYLMSHSNGTPFTSFEHPFLLKTEIDYKLQVYLDANRALRPDKWQHWKHNNGLIVKATQEACSPKISANLLEHRYGMERSSEAPLYKVKGTRQVAELERQLFDFFTGDSTPDKFGPRFDNLASYLRENRLGCKWAFLAYLAFLFCKERYFPILPSRFDRLLNYYGNKESIAGYVSWERYSMLLELAELLRSKLAMYGRAKAIEVQSYMWVVSYIIEHGRMERANTVEPDFNSELENRVRRARERERIGLLGEELIFRQEKTRLKKSGRIDLAEKVRLVSSDDDYSYDILSFMLDGSELHIEVKTTTRSAINDNGFWLSESERLTARDDEHWAIYRVWNIDSQPSLENLGNIVLRGNDRWDLNASSWHVIRK